MAENQSPSTPGGESGARSYLGLLSLLLVIVAFIAALVSLGVGPLATHEGSTEPAEPGERAVAGPSAGPAEGFAALPTSDTVLTRIAFGSCLDENGPMEILAAIAARRPQLFIFEGDNVYADASEPGENGAPVTNVSSPFLIRTAYATLGSQPAFKDFRAQVPIIATWDDHDYGRNDAGGDFEYKQASKQAFFDFFKQPKDAERYQRSDGIYESYVFGPEGRRVQIILLDTRWNRSPLLASDAPGTPGKERFMPDGTPSKTMLGDAQWAWLEQQLIEPADVRLIVSSIQVEAEGHGWERWGNLPRERDRLYQVLRDTGANNVIILSGDRHVAAIYKNDNALGYSLYEVTSSSLNKPLASMGVAPSPGETDPQRLDDLYTDANFGVVELDWTARAANLEIRDKTGGLIRGVSVPLEQEPAVIQ